MRTPLSSTSRGSSRTTVPSTQRSPSLGRQLDRQQAAKAARPRALRLGRSRCRAPRPRARVDRRDRRPTGSRWNKPTSTALTISGFDCPRQLAVVADADAFDARVAHLPEQAAELRAERDVRLQPLELVGRDRRKVDGVADDAGLQEVAQRAWRSRRRPAPGPRASTPRCAGVATTCGSFCSV